MANIGKGNQEKAIENNWPQGPNLILKQLLIVLYRIPAVLYIVLY